MCVHPFKMSVIHLCIIPVPRGEAASYVYNEVTFSTRKGENLHRFDSSPEDAIIFRSPMFPPDMWMEGVFLVPHVFPGESYPELCALIGIFKDAQLFHWR